MITLSGDRGQPADHAEHHRGHRRQRPSCQLHDCGCARSLVGRLRALTMGGARPGGIGGGRVPPCVSTPNPHAQTGLCRTSRRPPRAWTQPWAASRGGSPTRPRRSWPACGACCSAHALSWRPTTPRPLRSSGKVCTRHATERERELVWPLPPRCSLLLRRKTGQGGAHRGGTCAPAIHVRACWGRRRGRHDGGPHAAHGRVQQDHGAHHGQLNAAGQGGAQASGCVRACVCLSRGQPCWDGAWLQCAQMQGGAFALLASTPPSCRALRR